MKKHIAGIIFFALLQTASFAGTEKRLVIGAEAFFGQSGESRQVGLVSGLRKNRVLTLLSDRESAPNEDMRFSFDEDSPARFADKTARYRVRSFQGVHGAGREKAFAGGGAALFEPTNSSYITIEAAANAVANAVDGAVFSDGAADSFSIEFYLYPQTIETGSQVLVWRAKSPGLKEPYDTQLIRFGMSRNRLEVQFSSFFFSPDKMESLDVELSPISILTPQKWSRHTVEYNAKTGLLKYIIDGEIVAMRHTTGSGNENDELFLPIVGKNGYFTLGKGFNGILDEFVITSNAEGAKNSGLAEGFGAVTSGTRYAAEGGWVETRAIELGKSAASVPELLRVELSGGKSNLQKQGFENKYAGAEFGKGFSDNTEVQLFVRAGDETYNWEGKKWQSIKVGESLAGIKGRYVQLGMAFFPSADGNRVPYIDEISIVYGMEDPPLPPRLVTAIAGDGYVELSWKAAADKTISGYKVFWGGESSTYFGSSELTASPIDAGEETELRIEGLSNGVLYYFAIAAYGKAPDKEVGPLSREVRARPLPRLR